MPRQLSSRWAPLNQRARCRSKRWRRVPPTGQGRGLRLARVREPVPAPGHPALAGAIVRLLKDSALRTRMAGAGLAAGILAQIVKHLVGRARPELSAHELAGSLRHVDVARREAMSPTESLIQTLHPWVAFAIVPLFALANAGVALGGEAIADAAGSRLTWGVILGLVVGKRILEVYKTLAYPAFIAVVAASAGSRDAHLYDTMSSQHWFARKEIEVNRLVLDEPVSTGSPLNRLHDVLQAKIGFSQS